MSLTSLEFTASYARRLAKTENRPKKWTKGEKKIRRLYNKYRTPIIICMTLIFLELTILSYLSSYLFLNSLTQPAQTVIVSSEGPAGEMYPDYMGQYNLLRGVYRYNRPVYKHVDREDRFIISAGKIDDLIDKVSQKLKLWPNIHIYDLSLSFPDPVGIWHKF